MKWIKDNKRIAGKYNLRIIAYEAGQHAVGILGGENNDAVTKVLTEANLSPRMGELYTHYLEGWKQNGGGVICAFCSVGDWSKWGYWGLMRVYNSKPEGYPKFIATVE